MCRDDLFTGIYSYGKVRELATKVRSAVKAGQVKPFIAVDLKKLRLGNVYGVALLRFLGSCLLPVLNTCPSPFKAFPLRKLRL